MAIYRRLDFNHINHFGLFRLIVRGGAGCRLIPGLAYTQVHKVRNSFSCYLVFYTTQLAIPSGLAARRRQSHTSSINETIPIPRTSPKRPPTFEK